MPPVRMPMLGNILGTHARERGSKTALSCGGVATSYETLERRANCVANGLLRIGIEPGDRVAYLGKNCTAYFETLLGAAKARAVMTPVNWRLAAPELDYIFKHGQPRVLFVGRGFEDIAARVAPSVLRLEFAASYAAWRDGQAENPPGLAAEAA